MKTVIYTNDTAPKCVFAGYVDMPLHTGDYINISDQSDIGTIKNITHNIPQNFRMIQLRENLVELDKPDSQVIHISDEAVRAFLKGTQEPPEGSKDISIGYALEHFLERIETITKANPDIGNFSKEIQAIRDDTLMFSTTDIYTLRNCVKIAVGKNWRDYYLIKKLNNLL